MHQNSAQGFAPADSKERMLPMQVLAVCIGQATNLAGISNKTGINKQACQGAVELSEMGFQNDHVLDLNHHGGRDQAIYALGSKDLDYWQQQLDRELNPGVMGENLVIDNLDTHNVFVGDRLQMPNAILEATYPRIPCATFAAQMQDQQWPKKFLASGHLGVYFRVIKTGTISPGDAIELDTSHTKAQRILDLV